MELSLKNFRSPFKDKGRILELPFRTLLKETPGVRFYILLVLGFSHVVFRLFFFFSWLERPLKLNMAACNVRCRQLGEGRKSSLEL